MKAFYTDSKFFEPPFRARFLANAYGVRLYNLDSNDNLIQTICPEEVLTPSVEACNLSPTSRPWKLFESSLFNILTSSLENYVPVLTKEIKDLQENIDKAWAYKPQFNRDYISSLEKKKKKAIDELNKILRDAESAPKKISQLRSTLLNSKVLTNLSELDEGMVPAETLTWAFANAAYLLPELPDSHDLHSGLSYSVEYTLENKSPDPLYYIESVHYSRHGIFFYDVGAQHLGPGVRIYGFENGKPILDDDLFHMVSDRRDESVLFGYAPRSTAKCNSGRCRCQLFVLSSTALCYDAAPILELGGREDFSVNSLRPIEELDEGRGVQVRFAEGVLPKKFTVGDLKRTFGKHLTVKVYAK